MASLPFYVFRRSAQSRRLTISIRPDTVVVVTRPRWVSERVARAFVEKNKPWIEKKLVEASKRKPAYSSHGSPSEYRAMKADALRFLRSRLEFFNQTYQFTFHRVSVKNPRTRWGSCSKHGNLNFSYRVIALPAELADYIIVHELCHLKEFNHSKRFWELVAQTIPDHKAFRKKLRGVEY